MMLPPSRRRPSGFRRPRFALLARGVILGALFLLAAAPARAWFYGGIAVAPPIVVGPPVVYPPPVYYPPVYYPPAYYPPPMAPHPAGGQACYAGAYICPLDHAPGTDGSCSCPSDDNGGRVWGHLG